MREIRMLRSTWRGLETWFGRELINAGAPVPDPTDERGVETESWSNSSGTARRKGRQRIRSTYSHRATLLLYRLRSFIELAQSL